jgi:hypothetical protein
MARILTFAMVVLALALGGCGGKTEMQGAPKSSLQSLEIR